MCLRRPKLNRDAAASSKSGHILEVVGNLGTVAAAPMLKPERTKRMQKRLIRFYQDQSGAVTVDWVVLTAAVVGLGIVVMIPIAYSAGNSASLVSNSISDAPVGYPASSP